MRFIFRRSGKIMISYLSEYGREDGGRNCMSPQHPSRAVLGDG